MSRSTRGRRTALTAVGAMTAAAAVLMTAGCSADSGDADGDVTIEFAQWWEPELPEGALRSIMDDFEAANPGITVELISGPYASTKEQLFAGAASGTMPDVVGLDGAWVSDFAKQGAIADLTSLMNEQGMDDSKLASQIQIDGATYMIPVVNFVYPLFVNTDLLSEAGIDQVPSTRTEFETAAKAITDLGSGASGWVLPLSLEAPNGIQNDVMSWNWASGGSMLTDSGQPDVTNADVASTVEYVKSLWDDGVIAAGSFTMKEQDKVEEFTNGRVGMMIDSLSHINLIQENNPDLNFDIAAIPAEDGYDGSRGIPYASWGIGVADGSDHQAEALKLVEYLMSADVNSELSTIANAFPGNVDSTPEFGDGKELFEKAFEIYQSGYPANEFTGLPVSEELMRQFDTELQKYLSGDESVDEMLSTVQDSWTAEF
ncbi:sugar ABC transporter substrate-binding protein [Homoserinibacter sp. GY 40078]|uniref:ABC transporter substrate-binding protein n=1 Tax=Homoserinibacter sp. GY 40078 TaxID=2603275 RepID=UPI0011CC6797|nr:sugar ABC transporter substrate-binding protein [Homoserinibacter sp. GY 40078]TXK17445.1 sugar ABC transporter substrate-binding protein [Homoserinibacter sp. GY 40078]